MMQPAHGVVPWIDFEAEWTPGFAETHRVRAAGKVAAARGWTEEVWRGAFDRLQAIGLRCRAARHRRLEPKRVGMRGAIEHIVHAPFLNDLAGVHDGHVVGHP